MNSLRLLLVSVVVIDSTMVTDAAAQTIAVNPDTLTFSGRVGGPNPAPQAASITNIGAGTLSWRITGSNSAWLSVSPLRGSAPTKLSLAVNLVGLKAGAYQDTVDLASNDPDSPNANVVVMLTVAGPAASPTPAAGQPTPPPTPPLPPGAQWAEYQVEFLYIGYTGLLDGYPNCAVNTRGTDRLTGTLIGIETSDPDDDIEYNGTLARVTAMDICDTKGRNRPADIDDEQVWCNGTITGSATMRANLKVYSATTDRGAWLKVVPDSGVAPRNVTGNCAAPKLAQYQSEYPGGGSGGSPDGQAIEDQFGATRFVVGNLARLRVGVYPPDPSQSLAGSPGSGWTLRVIRKIR